MTAILALLLMFQGDPRIEKVEPLLGNVNRPYLWTPYRITLTSAADFTGDVVARSGFGFAVARRVTIKAGGVEVVLLPALNPEEFLAGKARVKASEDFVRPDRIVLVDARLPYAADLVSTDRILYQKISAEDLERTIHRGLLEAADVILAKEPLGSAVVAPTLEEARRAVESAKAPPPALEMMDRAIWPLAPSQTWVPDKRDWTLYFVTVYAFSAFVALTVVARRFPKFGLACLLGVALIGIAGYVAFPRSHVWVVGQSVEVVPPAGDAREHRVWFLRSALDLTVSRIEFPRLVKPVFPSRGGTEESFTLRVEERSCAVENLKLIPGQSACFGGVEFRGPTMRATPTLGEPLQGAVVVRAGRTKFLGDLAAGAAVPAEAGEGGIHPGPEFEAWKRFVGKDGLFGIRTRSGPPAAGLTGDLDGEQNRPPVFIQRFE